MPNLKSVCCTLEQNKYIAAAALLAVVAVIAYAVRRRRRGEKLSGPCGNQWDPAATAEAQALLHAGGLGGGRGDRALRKAVDQASDGDSREAELAAHLRGE